MTRACPARDGPATSHHSSYAVCQAGRAGKHDKDSEHGCGAQQGVAACPAFRLTNARLRAGKVGAVRSGPQESGSACNWCSLFVAR